MYGELSLPGRAQMNIPLGHVASPHLYVRGQDSPALEPPAGDSSALAVQRSRLERRAAELEAMVSGDQREGAPRVPLFVGHHHDDTIVSAHDLRGDGARGQRGVTEGAAAVDR